jgi:hypothetical protein
MSNSKLTQDEQKRLYNEKVLAKLEADAALEQKAAHSKLAYDFDNAMKSYEQKRGVVTVKIVDEYVNIPAEPPIRVMTAMGRLESDDNTNTGVKMARFLNSIFPERITQKLMQTNATWGFVNEILLPQLFSIWGYSLKETGEPLAEKAETPKKG